MRAYRYFSVHVQSRAVKSPQTGGRCFMAVSLEHILQGPLSYYLLVTFGSPPRPPLGPILGLPTLSPTARVPLSPEAARTPGCFPGHIRRLQEDRMGKALRGGLGTGRN